MSQSGGAPEVTRQELFVVEELTLAINITIGGTNNRQITLDSINPGGWVGVQAQYNDGPFGREDFTAVGTTPTHTYTESGLFVLHTAVHYPNYILRGSVELNIGAAGSASISREQMVEYPVIKIIAPGQPDRWEDPLGNAIPIAPGPEQLRGNAVEVPHHPDVIDQEFHHTTGELKIPGRFASLMGHNVSGALTMNGQPIPEGATIELPSLGNREQYNEHVFTYPTGVTGDLRLWIYRVGF